jgi:PAS domain S-box-containing protein
VSPDRLDEKAEAVRRRAAELSRLAGADHAQQGDALRQAFAELDTAVEELQVAEEELRQQSEELAGAREAAEAAGQRYADLFEFAPDGYLVTDWHGTIREANRAACALLDCPAQFLAGKPLAIFVAEEERRAFRLHLHRLQQAQSADEWIVRLRSRDGPPFQAAVTVTWIRDGQGRASGFRWLVRDISARLRAEALERDSRLKAVLLSREQAARAEAEAARQRLAFLAQASAHLAGSLDSETALAGLARLAVPALADWCAVDLLDPDGAIRRLAIVHADPARVAWATEQDRLHPPDAEAAWGVPHVLRTARPQLDAALPDLPPTASPGDLARLRVLREAGIVSAMAVPILARRGPVGALSFATAESGRRYGPADLALAEDVARRAAAALENARLYREAQESDRRKDEFLAMLAHELRSPLAPMVTALRLLDGAPGDARQDRAVAILRRQVQHLTRLVDDLLDVSRIQSGKIKLERRPLDLREVARQCAESYLSDGPAGHAIALALDPQPVVVEGDRVRLCEIVGNLLDNAVKYSPAGSPIRLAVERDAGHGAIRVQDQGIGIAPEMLGRIFDVFAQADTSLDRAPGGLGLGLTVVRQLTEMHGGTVSASSQGIGRGTEFVVCLPLAAEPGAAGPDPVAPASAAGGRCHVLILEDNADARDALQAFLEDEGHRVTTAADGHRGLELAQALRGLDVALVDIGLPKLDGYEVARRVRGTPAGRALRLVALTGYGQPADRQRAMEAGFDAFLVKPVDPSDLLRILRPPADTSRPPGPAGGD